MKTLILTIVALLNTNVFAETYKIDTAASSVEWRAGKKIGSYHNGKIQIKSGEVQTNSKNELTAAQIVVDMKTISNDDLKDSPDNQKKLVGHLSNDDFFKVEKYPESTFKMTGMKLKPGSKDEYLVKGDLTIIGTTKPVEFPIQMTSDKTTLTGTGILKIERLNWGLKYGSGSIFKTLTADKIINDSFELTLKVVAKK
ncbi:MAG: YceI family protein [Bdellovibrionaceae bacterium]|nr:YceI family protein [Pseudobdellovibrionaceae bacterium]